MDERPACMSDAECVRLTALGGVPRVHDTSGIGRFPRVVVRVEVLCWWCREKHFADEVEACMAMERPVAAAQGDTSLSSTVRMPTFLKEFPELWEFLAKPSYKDGSQRQLGKISFGLNSGGIQLTLSDPSSSTYCSRNYPTLDDALLAFEVGLADGSLTWRPSGPPRGKKRP